MDSLVWLVLGGGGGGDGLLRNTVVEIKFGVDEDVVTSGNRGNMKLTIWCG